MRCVSTLVALAAVVTLVAPPLSSAELAAAGQAKPASKSAAKPVPMSPASIKAGSTVYAKVCRACHGMQGRGDGIAAPPGKKPANLVDAEWKHGSTDAELFKIVKEGIAPFDGMKPLGGRLSDTEIWQVIHYVRSLSKSAKK
jgi:putative copper resistance protein D